MSYSVNELSPYERRALSQIEGWRDEKDGALTKALNAAGRPFEWASDKIPDEKLKPINAAVLGAMEMLRDASRWSYLDRGIVKEARKVGIEVADYRDLRHHDIEKLDRIARSCFGPNKIIAALEGAECGLGGMS